MKRKINLLYAIYLVNKAAKVCRDQAQKCYNNRNWAGAKIAKRRRLQLYALKAKGVLLAYARGDLVLVEIQNTKGLYRGQGYTFHCNIIPKDPRFQEADICPRPNGQVGALDDAVEFLDNCEAVRIPVTDLHRGVPLGMR